MTDGARPVTFDLACEVDWDASAIRACGGEIPPFPDRHVQTLVAVALFEAGAAQGEQIELSVAFAEPQRMRELNVEHRDIDAPTDVLSFPIDGLVEELPPGMPRALGDVVVCPEYVVGQLGRGETMLPHGPGQEAGDATLDAALERCVVHGVLHLAGFDHELGDDAAREMFDLEQLVLDRIRVGSGP